MFYLYLSAIHRVIYYFSVQIKSLRIQVKQTDVGKSTQHIFPFSVYVCLKIEIDICFTRNCSIIIPIKWTWLSVRVDRNGRVQK